MGSWHFRWVRYSLVLDGAAGGAHRSREIAQFGRCGAEQIVEAHDAEDLAVLIEDGEPADLVAPQQMRGVFHVQFSGKR